MKVFRNAPRTAALFAALYFILSCIYIVVTDKLALHFSSGDPENLYHASIIKGLLFMLINSSIFYALAYFLIKRVHTTLHLLDANKQIMVNLEKRSMVGVFAASAAHDANNSLAVIRIKLSLLEQKMAKDQLQNISKDFDAINSSLEKIEMILRKVRDLTRSYDSFEKKEFDISTQITPTVEFSRMHPKLSGAEISIEALNDFSVKGDPYLFEQALLNLLINSAESTDKSKILIRYGKIGSSHNIEIHDNGHGFSSKDIERLDGGFYTTKEYGTGLGLLTVQSCAENLGGQMEITQSPQLGGALVRISLPC